MKTLNLVYPEKSDIKWKPSKFPDGQQQIIIEKNGVQTLNYEDNYKYGVTIKSRLNNWLDLELITCAVASLRELKVKEIHLYAPYFLGSRSDRKFEDGGNNYLKDVICPIINSLKFDSVRVLDPHSDVLEACLNGFNKLSNEELIIFATGDLYMKDINGSVGIRKVYDPAFILISPDAGASKKIYKLAEQIGYKGDIITYSKERGVDGKLTKCVRPYNKLCTIEEWGKDLIIIDDICDGGQTFINISKDLRELLDDHKQYVNKSFGEYGKIYLIVTHGIFSKGFEELSKYFDGIYCTNSYRDITVEGYQRKEEKGSSLVKQLNVF